MKVCTFGLWHLGSVTSACLAEAGINTIGIDEDESVIRKLREGIPPLFEPGLEELVQSGLASKNLSFTVDKSAVRDADLVWITFDTPVDEDDNADVRFVEEKISSLFPYLKDQAVVLISSQIPVGTTAILEKKFQSYTNEKKIYFAYSPENLRLGKAIHVFKNPERVVVGLRSELGKALITKIFEPFSTNIIWVGTEASELTKHAINAFLATCVVFANEIASIAEKIGTNASEVEKALRSEPRIGPHAYIRPGGSFSGGTLARDVRFLSKIGSSNGLPLKMIDSLLPSNEAHMDWPIRKLQSLFSDLRGKRVTILGLTYKAGTNALRRSLSIALIQNLAPLGASIVAYDPAVKAIPNPPHNLEVAQSLSDALELSNALLVMTEWKEFKDLTTKELLEKMSTPVVLDQNRFLSHLAQDPRIRFYSVGTPTDHGPREES